MLMYVPIYYVAIYVIVYVYYKQNLNYGIEFSGDNMPVVLGNVTQLQLVESNFTISIWVYIPTCG